MNVPVIRYLLMISIMICSTNARAFSLMGIKNYMPSLPSALSKKQEFETVQKDYPVSDHMIITVKNNIGDIYIKTEWNQDKVSLTATKKASNQEQLQQITIAERMTPQGLIIETEQPEKNKGQVDYTLIVPAKSTLNLVTNKGNITIDEANGPIAATTTTGDILVNQSAQTVVATTTKNGSIKIQQPRGSVQATACRKGNIIITDAFNNVLAHTQQGSISMKSKHVPALSKIKLATNAGTIDLQLPPEVNADVKASTSHGTVISKLPITLKPYTTTLDSHAWRQFKEQVNGTIGTGEAQITLSTKRGHIKILDTKTV